MFKVHDIVGVPDGRTGLVHKVLHEIIVVKFGADGPIEDFPKQDIRFVTTEDSALVGVGGGKDFFQKKFIPTLKKKRVRGS